MKKILFVCHGNICRSPMAEFILKDALAECGLEREVFVASAATSYEEIGNGIYPPVRDLLRDKGIHFSPRAARRMTPEDYAEFDLLIGMDESNKRSMLKITGGDPDGKIHLLADYVENMDGIPDPWYTGAFERAFCEIRSGVYGLLETLK